MTPYKPSALNGIALLTGKNKDIMKDICNQADVQLAILSETQSADLKRIEKRHADELKAFKRNSKHRKKKVMKKVRGYEAMTPVAFAQMFDGGVEEGLFKSPYGGMFLHQLDYNGIEKRILAVGGHMSGKSIMATMYGINPQKMEEAIARERIRAGQTVTGRMTHQLVPTRL